MTKDFRDVPTENHELSEEDIKRELVVACRALHTRNLDEGVAGHITAKSRDRDGAFWVTPLGLGFGEVNEDDLVLVDHAGRALAGTREVSTAAFLIHSHVHAARPDAQAVVHTHGLFGRTFAATGRLLRPINQNACAFFRDHGVFGDYRGPVLDEAAMAGLTRALGAMKALVLQHHGLLTVGGSIAEATWWMLAFERCCQAELMSLAAGDSLSVDEEIAALAGANVGTPRAALVQYGPTRRLVLAGLPRHDRGR